MLLHTPSKWREFSHTNLLHEFIKSCSRQRLRKSVCKLVLGGDVRDTESTCLNVIANKIKIKRKMLHPGVKDQVGAEIRCPYIITVYGWSVLKCNTQISKKRANPTQFGCGIGHGSVLSFCGGASNTILFARGPCDRSRAHIDDVSISGDIVITVSGPVSVWIHMKSIRRVTANVDTMRECCREISKDAFCSLPVFIGWRMHELGETINTVGDVWSSESQILKVSITCMYSFGLSKAWPEVSVSLGDVAIGVETWFASCIFTLARRSMIYFRCIKWSPFCVRVTSMPKK